MSLTVICFREAAEKYPLTFTRDALNETPSTGLVIKTVGGVESRTKVISSHVCCAFAGNGSGNSERPSFNSIVPRPFYIPPLQIAMVCYSQVFRQTTFQAQSNYHHRKIGRHVEITEKFVRMDSICPPAQIKFGKNMCGRYSAAGNLNELAKLIDFICRAPFFAPRYNIAPRQQAPVIFLENFQPVLKLMRWGLVPSWSKDEKIGDSLINARAETISEKTSFKKPYNRQRCLIPADGFFEWQRAKRDLTPFRFSLRDNSFFCFAGIFDKWLCPPKSGEFIFDTDLDAPPPSQVIETFSIITTTANEMVGAVHERMPVIIPPDYYLQWIDNERYSGDFVKFLLRPFPAEDMACYRVSKLVNNPKNDSPKCFLPG